MKLHQNAVGISDINTYRDCPTRFEYAIRRWTEGSEPPERKHPDTMYGSAIHEAIHLMEAEVLTVEEAVQRAFDEFAPYLDPEDMQRLEDDLATYMRRDYKGVRTVANETEVRVPLFKVGGETIYFMGKLDRVYERIDQPGSFIHIDYKSSKWKKTEAEVHEDIQMWAYNMAIFEWWPECERLTQVYDQLMYGAVPTRKSAAQRAQIKVWLERQVRAILNNENPEPKFNQWCPYCPLLPDCPEPKRTAEFAAARIAGLAPPDAESGKLVLDPDLMDVYIDELPRLKIAKKAIEEFEAKVTAAIKDMPEAVRAYHGYGLGRGRRSKAWTPEALRKAHEMMGDDFYALVKMTQGRVKDYLGGDKAQIEELMALAELEAGQPAIRKLGE
jgi:hypothetical protein